MCLGCAGDDGLPKGVGEEACDKDHVLPGAHILPAAALPSAVCWCWTQRKLQLHLSPVPAVELGRAFG